ncbi:DUF805 domain-containing protein [Parerythrobacter aestuarii]|uniref:DUF805 domain-containing protein n=1 Tax=Parerythrobacter aestuarii TaxID=3020909 RepID=UPI0024DE0DA4|nr:DUF805 domain-containing protein [Parerythrobacter aestuarii]
MEWMFLPYKRYADFSGRSRRKEYWMFFLFVMIVYIVLWMLGGGMAEMDDPYAEPEMNIWMIALVIFALATFIPGLAVQVRRFHDQDKSGWFVLLGFIPLVGGLIVLVFMCLEGTRGENRFGPDPKGAADPTVFE